MSGVDVGRVLRKTLPPPGEKGVLISFSVEGRYRDRLRSSLKAEISSAGMLGDKTLVLLEGEGGELLQDDGRVSSQEEAGLQGYLEKGGQALENIRELTQNMSLIFKGGKTGKRVDEILDNMVTASENLKKNTQGDWGKKLDQSLTRLDSVLAKVDKGEGTLGALVNDASLHEDLRVLLGGAKRSNLIRFLVNTAIKNKENKTVLDESKINAQ
jgi:phospholipid/cholesterol/gamma-HCH transport system substrate-binding protein